MQNPLVPSADPFANWLDRLGMIVFISDEMSYESMQPEYFQAMVRDSDISGTESAIWYM